MHETQYELSESAFYLSCWLQKGFKQLISKRFSEAGFKITEEQWRVLVCLWNKDGQTQSEIMETLRQHRSGICRIVSSLVDDDLVINVTDQLDKRSKRIFLTHKGKELKNGIMSQIKLLEGSMLSGVDPTEYAIYKKVLKKLVDNMGGIESIASESNIPLLTKL